MGVNSLPKTVTRHRRDCDLNPGPSASSTLTTRLPSHTVGRLKHESRVGAHGSGWLGDLSYDRCDKLAIER